MKRGGVRSRNETRVTRPRICFQVERGYIYHRSSRLGLCPPGAINHLKISENKTAAGLFPPGLPQYFCLML